MKTKSVLLFVFPLLCLVMLLSGCGGRADYDIRGSWNYTLIDENGNTYDAGTITFSGTPTKGSFVEVNLYQVEYEGQYKVSGNALTAVGDETWKGTLVDANTISGTWMNEDNASGTWTATRQP